MRKIPVSKGEEIKSDGYPGTEAEKAQRVLIIDKGSEILFCLHVTVRRHDPRTMGGRDIEVRHLQKCRASKSCTICLNETRRSIPSSSEKEPHETVETTK